MTPKRPLRSEVEREKRLSRPTSIATPVPSIKEMSLNNNGDNCSLSGESSNRNSISKSIFFYVPKKSNLIKFLFQLQQIQQIPKKI